MTPSSPSYTDVPRLRRRPARPLAAFGTILLGLLLIALLYYVGRYALPPMGNLFHGGR
jgi:hypothetical protein